MVIKSEHVTSKEDFTTTGQGAPTKQQMGAAREEISPPPEGIEPGTLDELQYLMAEVSRYGGKGTDEGVNTLVELLIRTAVGFLRNPVGQDGLGSVLAACILLAEEKGLSIDAIAHYKLTQMVMK